MKKFLSGFFGILFVIIVVVGVVVCTYVFSSPSTEIHSDSREIVSGTWTDEEKGVTFEFSPSGKFTMTKAESGDPIYSGYFKIDQDLHKIKLLILPKNRDDSYDIGMQLYFFSKLTYKDLTPLTKEEQEQNDFSEDPEFFATCKFVFSDADGVYSCKRTDMEGSFYDGKTK